MHPDTESMGSSMMTFVSNIMPGKLDAYYSHDSDRRKAWCTEGIHILLGFGKCLIVLHRLFNDWLCRSNTTGLSVSRGLPKPAYCTLPCPSQNGPKLKRFAYFIWNYTFLYLAPRTFAISNLLSSMSLRKITRGRCGIQLLSRGNRVVISGFDVRSYRFYST